MESDHGYLMNVASILYIGCYVPELYANYKNKNSNIYNVPEKIIIFIGTSFAFAYALVNKDTTLVINYGPILLLDFIALLMRVHYAYRNLYIPQVDLYIPQVDDKSPDFNALKRTESDASIV